MGEEACCIISRMLFLICEFCLFVYSIRFQNAEYATCALLHFQHFVIALICKFIRLWGTTSHFDLKFASACFKQFGDTYN